VNLESEHQIDPEDYRGADDEDGEIELAHPLPYCNREADMVDR
jgi:hypothetical protein